MKAHEDLTYTGLWLRFNKHTSSHGTTKLFTSGGKF